MQTCRKDLSFNNKTLIFWNWAKQPTQLAWRLDPKFGKAFYHTDTLDDLIQLISEKDKIK